MKHVVKELIPPRSLNDFEHSVLKHLLAYQFPGQRELFQQIDGTKVRFECDTCPTVEFVVDSSYPKAYVKHRVPVEAIGEDVDGVRIHFLVHVINGYISELEILREDSESILQIPEIRSLQVF